MAVLINIIWMIRGDELSLLAQLTIPVITVLLFFFSALYRVKYCRGGQRARLIRRNLWMLLLYYVALLSILLIFGGLFHVERNYGGTFNLELFHTIRNYVIYYERTGSFVSVTNLVGNIVILIPLGVILPVMFRPMRRIWLFLPLMVMIAVGIEYLQWVLAVGTADVDDSLLNFLGAWAGYILTRSVQMILRKN